MSLYSSYDSHGSDVAYWVGGVPCGTYDEACMVAAVEPARKIACDFSRNRSAGRAAFMAYGVSRAKDGVIRKTALGPIKEGDA